MHNENYETMGVWAPKGHVKLKHIQLESNIIKPHCILRRYVKVKMY
jgi:hypothetical protein